MAEHDAVAEAETFLAPALSNSPNRNANEADMIDVLAASITLAGEPDKRRNVTKRALDLILSVHRLACDDTKRELVLDARVMRAVYGLLDVIALLGILPSISDGLLVHAKSQRKSVLAPDLVSNMLLGSHPKDDHLLAIVTESFAAIVKDGGNGIGPLLRDRILMDFLCGAAEIAFSPAVNLVIMQTYGHMFSEIVDGMYTPTLLPLLTSLLQPSAPEWFRSKLSEVLSLVPLRPHGTRQVIEFLAASHHVPSEGEIDSTHQPQEPALSVDATKQAAKLLSSVPRTMTPEEFFTELAPQLLEILDGAYGSDMSKAAAYVIGVGILGRKSTGSPGAIGWRLFLEPIHRSIDPTVEPSGGYASPKRDLEAPIISEKQLGRALTRLSTLVTSRPSPGLARRLIGPIMLHLWGLMCFSRSRHTPPFWAETTARVLGEYLRLSASAKELDMLIESIFWDGTTQWTFGPGDEGGVEIRRRAGEQNMVQALAEVDNRTESFLALISSEHIDGDTAGTVFLRVVRRWLIPGQRTEGDSSLLDALEDSDPLQTLITARLAQGLLERLKDSVMGSSTKIVELVQQILEAYVDKQRNEAERIPNKETSTYAMLGCIAEPNSANLERSRTLTDMETSKSDSTDSVSIAISLLANIVSSPDFEVSQVMDNLNSILASLRYIIKDMSNRTEKPRLVISAQNVEKLLVTVFDPDPTNESDQIPDQYAQDRAALDAVLRDFTSSTPSVRGEALQSLHRLASASSPVLDVAAMTIFLLQDGLADADEFVYLAGIRTLVEISALNPQLVARLVVDAFVDSKDDGERDLEARLRIGETLVGMVERFTGLSTDRQRRSTTDANAAIRKICDGAVLVAGRRGQRIQALEARRKRELANEQSEQGSSILSFGEQVIPPNGSGIVNLDDPIAGEHDTEQKWVERILHGWEDTGLEEDVRIRTSAMCILGQALELGSAVLIPGTVETAVDLGLAILTLETGPEKAILRRAAALEIMSLLRAEDEDSKPAREGGSILKGENWAEIERVVSWAADMDEDALVKGHARTILEGLDAWKTKRALRASAQDAGLSSELEMQGKLRGLQVDPERSSRVQRANIEEVE